MSQTIIFSIGIGILLLAVFLAIWLADGEVFSRKFTTQGKLKVEVSDPEGKPLQEEAIIAALEEALTQAQLSISKHHRSTSAQI